MKLHKYLGADYIALPWLLMATSVLFRDALGLWWTYDDPYLMTTVVFTPLRDIMIDPKSYQTISIFSFIPWIFASLKLDYLFFGFDPYWYYVHQLVSIFLISVGIYAIGRLWNKYIALVGATLFLLTGPAFMAGHVLMLRHYAEGAVFSQAVVLLVLYLPGKTLARVLGSFLYLLACLSKEVYLPLLLVLPFLYTGTLQERLKSVVPYALALAVYTLWRMLMLPQGGIGPDMGEDGLAGYWHGWSWALMVLGRTAAGIWGADIHGYGLVLFLLLHLALLILTFASIYRLYGFLYCVGASVLIITSMLVIFPRWAGIGMENFLSLRLLFHISVIYVLWFIFILTVSLRKSSGTIIKSTVLVLTAGVFLAGMFNRVDLRQEAYAENILVHSRNYEFFYNQPGTATLSVNALDHHWADLSRLRTYFGNGVSPSACFRPFDFREDGSPYYEYSLEHGGFRDVTREFLEERNNILTSIDNEVSFESAIVVDRGKLSVSVKLDGHESAILLLIGDKPDVYWGAVPIGRNFSLAMTTRPYELVVRLMVILKDQRISLSPEWTVNLGENIDIAWSSREE